MAKILLMAPPFFGYRGRVADEFRRLGHEVLEVPDRPSESTLFKSFGRISYRLVDSKISKYAKETKELFSASSFDLFVYLSGMSFCFTREQFKQIRKVSKAHFVAALWDSFANCQRFSACRDLFDEVYSFEPNDCDCNGLKLRPLFYSDAYTGLPLVPADDFTWDACFIGSVHQRSKFHAVHSTCEELRSRGLHVFEWFYMPSNSVEILRKFQDPDYRGVEFQHQSLSPNQVADIYTHSRAVIDSPQSGQAGLTIRTLETLGARRKLITANADVCNYDFYRASNVRIVGQGNSLVRLDDDFFATPYEQLPQEIYENYSLRAFARALLGEDTAFKGYRKVTA